MCYEIDEILKVESIFALVCNYPFIIAWVVWFILNSISNETFHDVKCILYNNDMQYLFQQYYKDISAKYDTAAT